jgi:putative DNA primase/helicase
MREHSKDRARGMWKSILPALGIPSKLLNGKHQPCPFCGGKDRFRFTDYDGTGGFICSQCGAGSGFDLAMKVKGWNFKTAAAEVDRIISGPNPPATQTTSATDPRPAMRALWQISQPISADDPAGKYLSTRCAVAKYPRSLRFVPNLFHPGTRSTFPGMLAVYSSPDGTGSHLHMTYLDPSGGKAHVAEPRMFARGKIEPGGAVRLAQHEQILGIAEGIETALSAQAVTGLPCWAALNTSLLTKWQAPQNVKLVIIFADNDAHFAGQRAAFDLAQRLATEGRGVSVCAPAEYKDWNDVHVHVRTGSSAAQAEISKAIEIINANLAKTTRAGGIPPK